MKLFSRENYLKKIRGFYNADDLIKVITGVRRCGKSSLMATIADEIRQSGVPEENLIYIDLDLRPNKGIKTADQKSSTDSGRRVIGQYSLPVPIRIFSVENWLQSLPAVISSSRCFRFPLRNTRK